MILIFNDSEVSSIKIDDSKTEILISAANIKQQGTDKIGYSRLSVICQLITSTSLTEACVGRIQDGNIKTATGNLSKLRLPYIETNQQTLELIFTNGSYFKIVCDNIKIEIPDNFTESMMC